MNIDKEIKALEPEIIELRRKFHMYPELGLQEFETAKAIEAYLSASGIETARCYNTGVVGLIHGGKPGRTVLLRSDMDALPITEQNNLPYKSRNQGVMHACGHDCHMAMLLVAAKILAAHRQELCGTVKLVFEPNEEEAGAARMVAEGVLENPRVDASFALHIWSQLENGLIGLTAGPTMAEMYNFRIMLKGKGGHTSAPQDSVDPIICAANIIQTVQTIQTREISPMDATAIMFGSIHGGTTTNIIPDTVELTGTLRYLYDGDDDKPQHPRKRFERIVNSVAEAHRIRVELEFTVSNYTVINDPKSVQFLKDRVLDPIVGQSRIVPYVSMGGEDFSEFTNRNAIPGALIFLGTGSREMGTDQPHHAPTFKIDERNLITGVNILVRTAMEFLTH